jgi:hypothetical protein
LVGQLKPDGKNTWIVNDTYIRCKYNIWTLMILLSEINISDCSPWNALLIRKVIIFLTANLIMNTLFTIYLKQFSRVYKGCILINACISGAYHQQISLSYVWNSSIHFMAMNQKIKGGKSHTHNQNRFCLISWSQMYIIYTEKISDPHSEYLCYYFS